MSIELPPPCFGDAIDPAVHDEEESVGVRQQRLLLQLVLQHHVGGEPKSLCDVAVGKGPEIVVLCQKWF